MNESGSSCSDVWFMISCSWSCSMTQELMNIEECCCLMEFHARLMMHSFHLKRFQQANKRGNFSSRSRRNVFNEKSRNRLNVAENENVNHLKSNQNLIVGLMNGRSIKSKVSSLSWCWLLNNVAHPKSYELLVSINSLIADVVDLPPGVSLWKNLISTHHGRFVDSFANLSRLHLEAFAMLATDL